MMRSISNELSRRARYLCERDGYCHEIVNGGPAYQALVLPEIKLDVDEDNTLTIRRQNVHYSSDGYYVLMEGPIGTLIETSPDDVLEWALAILRRHMVLEELGGL